MNISGPAILVRKNINNNVSVSGHYYVDNVTGASVDVETYGSEYVEERTEIGAETHLLHKKTSYTISYGQSDENDYHAKSANFDISQSFFGDLTTLNMGISRGWDTIEDSTDPTFQESSKRQNYRLGLSQIITPKMTTHTMIEAITNQGYLESPYRDVLFLEDANTGKAGIENKEQMPDTRTSYAWAIGAIHYLFETASLGYRYRFFSDDWDIEGHTLEFEYRQRINHWTFFSKLRHYSQSQADFYSDIFPIQNFLTTENGDPIRSRDKELSNFTTTTVGGGFSYRKQFNQDHWLNSGSIQFFVDFIQLDYDNFRDYTAPGENHLAKPLFKFNANAIRFFITGYY